MTFLEFCKWMIENHPDGSVGIVVAGLVALGTICTAVASFGRKR